MKWVVTLVMIAACGGTDPVAEDADASPCTQLPFAMSTPVPEASGAAWVSIGGTPALVIMGDSDTNGAYVAIDAATGDTIEQGALPLGGPGDDLEGIATRGDTLYVLTSAGWIRAYHRNAANTGFDLVEPPYAIGPVDLADEGGGGEKPPTGTGMVCPADTKNCGRNYEGMALVPDPARDAGPCIGFAASKADGHLYCLKDTAGHVAVDKSLAIAITKPATMADAAFADDGTLWVGANLAELNQVYRVDGWSDVATASVVAVAQIGPGFAEGIAAKADGDATIIYRTSDTSNAPSLLGRYRCQR